MFPWLYRNDYRYRGVPLYGKWATIYDKTRPVQVCQVSPWQEHGNLLRYIQKNTNADKYHLVGCITSVGENRALPTLVTIQLRGSAAGLAYLHSQGVVHGNGELHRIRRVNTI